MRIAIVYLLSKSITENRKYQSTQKQAVDLGWLFRLINRKYSIPTQGTQFTSMGFMGVLRRNGILISMDGRGGAGQYLA